MGKLEEIEKEIRLRGYTGYEGMLISRCRELEDAIRAHKDSDERYIDGDEELYAVLKEGK